MTNWWCINIILILTKYRMMANRGGFTQHFFGPTDYIVQHKALTKSKHSTNSFTSQSYFWS